MKKTLPLLSLREFILTIDFMTTAEFCNTYGVPHPMPRSTVDESVNDFLLVDAIKCKIFIEYAKFLAKPLNINMFSGDKPVFDNFIVQTEQKWQDFYKGIRVFNRPGENVRLFSHVFRKDEEPARIESLVGKISHFNKLTMDHCYHYI